MSTAIPLAEGITGTLRCPLLQIFLSCPIFPEHNQVSMAGVKVQNSSNQTVSRATGLQTTTNFRQSSISWFTKTQGPESLCHQSTKSLSEDVAGTTCVAMCLMTDRLGEYANILETPGPNITSAIITSTLTLELPCLTHLCW